MFDTPDYVPGTVVLVIILHDEDSQCLRCQMLLWPSENNFPGVFGDLTRTQRDLSRDFYLDP